MLREHFAVKYLEPTQNPISTGSFSLSLAFANSIKDPRTAAICIRQRLSGYTDRYVGCRSSLALNTTGCPLGYLDKGNVGMSDGCCR
jgi:hypothetical protein